MRVLAVITVVLALALPAAAADDIYTAAAREFAARAVEVNGWRAEDVAVEGVSLLPKDAVLPAGADLRAAGPLVPGPGRRSLRLAVVRNGKSLSFVRAVALVRLFGPVVVLKRAVPRHHVLAADDLEVRRMDLAGAGKGFFAGREGLCGKRLRRALTAGSVVHAADVESVPLVRRGEVVDIVARVGAIEVRVPGLAREDGRAGETVRVKNMASRRLVSVRVAGRGLVAPMLEGDAR